MQLGILEFKVFELFALVAAVTFEEVGQVGHSFADFFMQLVEGCLCFFFQLLDTELDLALLFSLCLEGSLEIFHVCLS